MAIKSGAGPSNDGLDRELKFLNPLEARLCTTCALDDQENSIDTKRERSFFAAISDV